MTMTNNTIPNVPRELLERAWRALANSATGREIGAYLDADPCAPECAETCARASMCATCSADLSAPSPVGVDGLGNTAKLLLPALRQYMHNDGSGLLAGYDLETTQAIIDGMRGEVADLGSMLATVSKAGLRVRTERDQQAQRIGELEGLLREAREFAAAYVSNSFFGHNARKTLARIDFALSAGKDSDQ